MKLRLLLFLALPALTAICFAKANGAWLQKVPAADRNRVDPYLGQPEAIAAGQNLFHENCAECHGANAKGKGSRPCLRSERIKGATDGDLAWLLKNGEVYKGRLHDLWTDVQHVLSGSLRSQECVYTTQGKIAKSATKAHPTQHPIELVTRCILSTTLPGDFVVDLFSGSGTVAVACKQTGRNFVAFEISAKYVEIGNRRLGQGVLI